MRFKLISIFVLALLVNITIFASPLENHDDENEHQHKHIHFAHPLVTETPSPDTKIRMDYFFKNMGSGKVKNHTTRFEFEYAFVPSFSVELDIPYTIIKNTFSQTESNLNTINVAFKFANFSFEKNNILLGYGLEFGIPSGKQSVGIGNDHIFDIEPFFSIGYKYNNLEFIGHAAFGIPTNLDANVGDEVENELESSFSILYHASKSIQLLLEFDRTLVINGEESGTSILNISPGIKFNPTSNKNLIIGISAGFPSSKTKLFNTRIVSSIFYHFD